METLKGHNEYYCSGGFAVTDGDIVLRPTNSNFNKREPYILFFPPNIVSVTISCNDYRFVFKTVLFCTLYRDVW